MKADIKGLTKLARAIARVPKKQFNMEHWWQKAPCGTSGCIAGHAAALFPHRFRKEAYAETWEGDTTTGYDIVHRRTGRTGEEAFADGFHLTPDDANEITLEHMYRTPKRASKGIMALVGRLKKELK